MRRVVAVLLAAALLPACMPNDAADILLGINLLIPVNGTNHFSISGVSTSVDGQRTYSWVTTKGQANLSLGSILAAGSIRLEVFDQNGTLVHDNTYKAFHDGALTAFTDAGGVAGTWTLRFTFNNAGWSGSLSVDADLSDNLDAVDIAGLSSFSTTLTYRAGWAAATAGKVSVGGVGGGSVRVRVWDPSLNPAVDGALYDVTVNSGVGVSNDPIPAAGAGTWTIVIDYSSASGAGAVTISQP